MTKFIVEIDERKLAIRLAETACGLVRTIDMTDIEAYEIMSASPAFDQFNTLARVAMEFFQEHVDNVRPVQ